MSRRVFAAILAFLLVVAPTGHSLKASSTVYVVEDLGTTTDGLVPTVTGMNASGQVSGTVTLADSTTRAVRYTNGAGWAYIPGLETVNSAATAINASGDLTGSYSSPNGTRAFRYVDGAGVTTIPALPGGSSGVGSAIAANGDVVGYGDTAAGTRAWRASPGQTPVVPSTLTSTDAVAGGVNTAGQIAGSFVTAGVQHAFRLEADDSLTDLGTLEGPSGMSLACAIDSAGRVAGYSFVGGLPHAFLSTGGLPIDINPVDSPASLAEATSNGVSTGAFLTPEFAQHAFVHTDADGTSDLNDHLPSASGWVLMDAAAVNDSGQIAGLGMFDGSLRAYRLTPPASADTTAPAIKPLSTNPSSIAPPNHAMVAVSVSASATDDQDPNPVCTVTAIDGHGAPAVDYAITGPLAGSVRATGGATYTFTVTCSDASGNTSEASVDVVVPPDITAPTIRDVSASPYGIWPPNGKMVSVTVSVSATDDVDAAPACALASISGGSAADAVITGPLTASVRANKDASYWLHVTCSDQAGNTAEAWTGVAVSKDMPPGLAKKH